MTPLHPWETARRRSAMHRAVRTFFDSRGYLEIQTPLLTPAPIPESQIQLFSTESADDHGISGPLYLTPSPEVWMKQALAGGSPSLYQIARCFRRGEPADSLHRHEFTMLEWYRLNAESRENIPVMQELLHRCARAVGAPLSPSIGAPIRTLTMEEAFISFAGFSLEDDLRSAGAASLPAAPPLSSRPQPRSGDSRAAAAPPPGESPVARILSRRLAEHGLPISPGRAADGSGHLNQGIAESPADLFHRLFLTLVEPKLPADKPLIVTQWPALIPTLARPLPGTPWADRWELYINGIEIANCYGEENDRAALEAYWNTESPGCGHPFSPPSRENSWIDTIARGMPPCSGAAVGLDRLLAVLLGERGLDRLDIFPINGIIS